MQSDLSPQHFTIRVNEATYMATYTISEGLVSVDSLYGSAAATAIEGSSYATAITLFFGILNVARLDGKL